MPDKTEVGLTLPAPTDQEQDETAHQLLQQFEDEVSENRISWSTSLRLCQLKGAGSQGRVYQARRYGSDGFSIPVAVKFFSPEIYPSAKRYDQAMAMIGKVSAIVAMIQHENLLFVSHFLNQNRIRVMVMEWIDGFDLRELLTARMYGSVRQRCSQRRWQQLNQELFKSGPVQPRLSVETVLFILRDCLSALTALHDEGVLHNDLKPSNIMLNRAGRAKVIDVGAATLMDTESNFGTCTPCYSAPEVLTGVLPPSPSSDLASLGYMAIEMLSGRPIGTENRSLPEIIEQKRSVMSRIEQLFDECELRDKSLFQFLSKLTRPDTNDRYQSADDALADCRRISSGYQTETGGRRNIRIWISELLDMDLDAQCD